MYMYVYDIHMVNTGVRMFMGYKQCLPTQTFYCIPKQPSEHHTHATVGTTPVMIIIIIIYMNGKTDYSI